MRLRPSVVAILFAVFASVPLRAQSLDVLRSNFVSFYAPSSADTSNSRVRDSLDFLEEAVRSYTRAGFLRTDGSWEDINYSEIPSGVWSPWEHFRRMAAMAVAYRTPGQAFYRDPVLLGQLQAAIGYVPAFYGAAVKTDGNWWFWLIGGGLDLGPTLVLVGDEIDPAIRSAAVTALEARIGPTPYQNPMNRELTGQNLVWSCFTHLCLALLKNDAVLMEQVSDAMAAVTVPVAHQDGIQADDSFHQHGPQIYTGGYGGSFANDVARYVLMSDRTPFELPAERLATFADYVYEGIAWGLYHNYFDVSIVGREVSKSSTSGYNGLAALLEMSFASSPRQAEIRSAAARMLRTWVWSLPMEMAPIAARLEAMEIAPRWPSGYRHYYASDYSVARRDGWFASVKMLSWRTLSGESTNRENLLGSRQSDGRFYLVLRGDEYFWRDVWPTLDWSRLPGTTVEQKSGTAGSNYGYGIRSFVGGTGDASGGVSAMNFLSFYSQLTARKAWFFFDDAIVFLASGITCPTSNRVETVVEQWPLSSISSPLTVNGVAITSVDGWSAELHDVAWASADGVGYYFPNRATVNAKREIRSGSWSELASTGSTASVSNPLLTLWLDHGTAPVNATAAYAIVPNVDSDSMRTWAGSNPITLLANNDRTAAVRDNRTGSRGIAFWAAGAVDGIEVTKPSLLWIRDDGRRIDLSIAEPTQSTTTLDLTLPYSLTLLGSDSPVAVTTAARSTRIRFSLSGGKSVQASFAHAGRRHRAVRR